MLTSIHICLPCAVTSGVKAGVYSVLVGRTGVDCVSDQQIKSMHDLPLALPWLWAADTLDRSLEVEEVVAIGTAVYVQA